jgi:D-glycero-alpha-D-manno-heptose 1-phosphate guanylyltransferase
MVKEGIILAGGLGTRLKAVVADVPKCMAPVNDIPFIDFVITYLKGEGVTRFIFSLGYKNEIVIAHLNTVWDKLDKVFVIEDEPLGTGGAIKKACLAAKEDNVVIVNGDTIFNINIASLYKNYLANNAECTLALCTMYNFSRYGTVAIDETGTIHAFYEKQFCASGLINGGIYILNRNKFLERQLPEKFSFEKDYLEQFTTEHKFLGVAYQNYFIDIGVPEDYESFHKKHTGYKPPTATNHQYIPEIDIIELIGGFFEFLD